MDYQIPIKKNCTGIFERQQSPGAESGWDFSARWFEDIEDFGSIRTTEILPIDLNSLLYSMELTLSQLYEAKGDVDISRRYQKLAENRYEAINTLFWNSDEQVFSDIVWTEGAFSKEVTAASYYPMYFKAARRDYAEIQSSVLQEVLLFDGGLATTMIESGQQWDFPNGWAPLQWIAIRGLEHYGQNAKANEIKQRWLRGNQKVFLNTGKMMEKYNVADTTLVAGGGEYPTQDGFGWTNGVYLGLITDELRY